VRGKRFRERTGYCTNLKNKHERDYRLGYWPALFGQDGWILATFILSDYDYDYDNFLSKMMDWDGVKVPNHAKKSRPISNLLDLTSLVMKKKLYMAFRKILLVRHSGKDSSISPALVANQSTEFGLFCPLTELAI